MCGGPPHTVARHANTRFTPIDAGPLVCDPDEGGEIDSASFADADGNPYPPYKNNGNAIGQPICLWAQPTAADGVTFVGDRIETLCGDREERGVTEDSTWCDATALFGSRTRRGELPHRIRHLGVDDRTVCEVSRTADDHRFHRDRGLGGAEAVGDDTSFHGWLNDEFHARGMFTGGLEWDGGVPSVRL